MYATLDHYRSFGSKEHYADTTNGAFVYVFIGTLRDYMKESIDQLRIWNPTSPIYACVTNSDENKTYIQEFEDRNVHIVYLHELQPTSHHTQFHRVYTNSSMNNFWKYAMERFFYVEECMKDHHLSNVIHLEFDNMIYFSLENILRQCSSKQKILVPSDNETRCIAGTCFIPSHGILSKLNQFFSSHASTQNEMEMMMQFYKNHPDQFEGLPILPPGYPHPFKPIDGVEVSSPQRLFDTTDYYKGIFDAAAIGQYIGGIDTIHDKNNTDGFVSTHAAFQVDKVYFLWKKDPHYRLYMSVNQHTWYPIFNLHIHNKHMTRWLSSTPKTKHLPNVDIE